MPTAPMHPCPCGPRCPALLPRGVRRCTIGAATHERNRPNADVRLLYHKARWHKLKAIMKQRQPACQICLLSGTYTVGEVIDHIEPHRGDLAKFWDMGNLQNLCVACHQAKTGHGE